MKKYERLREQRSAEQIAKALNGKKSGKGWLACCPAHEDSRPSLTIGEGNSGTSLFHCFAGCAQSEVLAALKRLGLWGKS